MTQTHTHCKQVEPQPFPRRARARLAVLFALALIACVAAQFTFVSKPYFEFDGNFWFYPTFGFLSSILLVMVSKLFGLILKRRESYWEEKG